MLFNIDDFSGHTGYVNVAKDINDGEVNGVAGKYTNPNKKVDGYFWAGTGGKYFFPNVGGNELHNPKNKVRSVKIKASEYANANSLENLDDVSKNYWLEIGTYSSVNGGAALPSTHDCYVDGISGTLEEDENGDDLTIHPNGDATDKGWEGYTPPYLFNAGKGNYVYINRRWSSGNEFSPAMITDNINAVEQTGGEESRYDLKPAHFQYNINHGTSHFNNWNNFSTTGLLDNYKNYDAEYYHGYGYTLNSRYEPLEREPWKSGTMSDTALIYNPAHYNNVGPASLDIGSGHADEVCTFHPLSFNLTTGSAEVWRINNAAPIILRSTLGDFGFADSPWADLKDFVPAFLCGITMRNPILEGAESYSSYEYKSGILVLRINNDAMNHHFIHNQSDPTWPIGTGSANPDYQNFANSVWGLDSSKGINSLYKVNTPHNDFVSNTNHFSTFTMNTGALSSALYTSLASEFEVNFTSVENRRGNKIKLRNHASKVFNNDIHDENITFVGTDRLTPQFMNTSEVEQSGLLLDFYFHTRTTDGAYELWAKQDNYYSTDVYADVPATITYGWEAGGTFEESTDSGQLLTSATEASIESRTKAFIDFTLGSQEPGNPFYAGTYYYKVSLIYDGQYESPLHIGGAIPKTITLADDADPYKYIKLSLALQQPVMDAFGPRVTGLAIYRRVDGSDVDSYWLIGEVPFDSKAWWWDPATSTNRFDVYDYNHTLATYEANVGIPQSLPNTTLHYGIGEVHQGYMFVAKAWNQQLGNVRNYIFRSQPFNYFAYNWASDFLIMPEEVRALASFNSRLYAWGDNSLYKINPNTMIIEDEFEGVSILNKDCFVKTEFGLCFFDKNNIYLHDGNTPRPIGEPILYASDNKVKYKTTSKDLTQGNIRIQQGFKELLMQTLNNGLSPSIHYLGKKNAFLISLSDDSTDGKVFAYSLKTNRWDLWDAPKIQSTAVSKDSKLLVNDGTFLYDYKAAVSFQYNKYNREKWEWFSKDLTFGSSSQDKVFKTLSFTGTPSIYNYMSNGVVEFDETTNLTTNSIQAYVDDKPVALRLYNKFYAETNLGETIVKDTCRTTDTTINIKTNINKHKITGGVDTTVVGDDFCIQAYIRKGHLIKVNDEIMLVEKVALQESTLSLTNYTELTLKRAQMGTTIANHDPNDSVYIISPKFKFASGTKGRKLSVRLFNQEGHVDSIGVTYKDKTPK